MRHINRSIRDTESWLHQVELVVRNAWAENATLYLLL
jgi:hypothetical protein